MKSLVKYSSKVLKNGKTEYGCSIKTSSFNVGQIGILWRALKFYKWWVESNPEGYGNPKEEMDAIESILEADRSTRT